jgi:DNA-binding response OmpR family regulator
MRVLVAEDEQLLADSVVSGLRHLGFAVDVCYDGDAAVERVAVHAYDVVILDRDLPKVHGDEVCRRVIAHGHETRVLMLTAAASIRDRVDGLGLGAYDYLTKPFSLGQIDVVLQRIRDRVALEAENRRLSRQVSQREGADARTPILSRLEAIESRLGRIESLLREPADPRDRFRP